MDENLQNTSAEGGKQILYAQKFILLREKLTENYRKGCRYLRIAKIISAVLFVLFTAVGVYVSGKTGAYMLWLVLWIVLIFLNVGIFTAADYCKHQMQMRVLPFLENDSQTEFPENDILSEEESESEEEAE